MALDWNDLRVCLAVIEHGSTGRASAALGIDQTTCARRVTALERAVGVELFARKPSGFTLTPDGERLRPLLERMGRAAGELELGLAQAARARDQVLRLSVADLLVEPVVQPALSAFRKRWPDVRIDLAVETRYVDIMAGEADLALRPGSPPIDPQLIVRRVADNPVGIYCTAAYAERFGMPGSIFEFVERPFACMEGRALSLLSQYFPDKRPKLVVSTLQPLVEAVGSGDFAAILPSLHADRLPGLRKCFGLEIDTGALWLVYHPRLRGDGPTRDLVRALADGCRRFGQPRAA